MTPRDEDRKKSERYRPPAAVEAGAQRRSCCPVPLIIYTATAYASTVLTVDRYPYRNFPQNSQNFPQNSQNFPQTHKRTLEYSKCSPIRRLERRTEDYPILETFRFFITERRFGGVGTPEDLENASLCLYQNFLQNKKSRGFWRNMLDTTNTFRKMYQNFPQNF